MKQEPSIGGLDERFTPAHLAYDLPDGLIAQQPLPERDASRLLILDRDSGGLRDGHIGDLPGSLRGGDLLVLNDTKVLPAKFTAYRATGGKVEGLFEQEERPGQWRVMLTGSKRLRVGERLDVVGSRESTVTLLLRESCGSGHWDVEVEGEGTTVEILERVGRTPLPPYIRRSESDGSDDAEDRARYQTVYARRRESRCAVGAVAAPTAGLHLSRALIARIRDAGIDTAFVTLHVGAGTFNPIRVRELSRHKMQAEWYELTQATADAVRRCRERGGRVVAVGTTSVRVLETAVGRAMPAVFSAAGRGEGGHGPPYAPRTTRTVQAGSGMTDLFIHPQSSTAPASRFGVVDALLTNFHLPGSTLLALVMTFAGVQAVRRAYDHAMAHAYRFYSYGDAMLIV